MGVMETIEWLTNAGDMGRVALSKGLITGFSIVEKFGENPDIDTTTFEYIWDGGGVYVAPTQARLHDVVSDNIADEGTVLSSGTATGGSLTTLIDTTATFSTDTVAAGDVILNDTNMDLGTVISVDSETQLTVRMFMPTNGDQGGANAIGDSYRIVTNASTGASIFWISGLSASFTKQEEFVVLNGTTDVETANTYIRQSRARVYGPGTTGAVGTITSTAQTDATVTCQIIDGNNQTQMAIDTIPVGKTGFMIEWWGSLSRAVAATSIIHLRIGTLAGISYLIQPRAMNSTGNTGFSHKNKSHLIPGGTDVWVEANSSANNVGVTAGFDIILVDNDQF